MGIKSFRILAMAAIACGGLAMASDARAVIITLNPTSDGWVDVAQSGTNFDADTVANILNQNQRVGLMRFSLPAVLQTATINSATFSVTPTVDGGAGGPFIYIGQPDTDWIADEATFDNPSLAAAGSGAGWDGAGGDINSSIAGGNLTHPTEANIGGGGKQFLTGATTWPLNTGRVSDWANGTRVSGVMVFRQYGTPGTQSGSYGTLESTTFDAPVLTIDYTPIPEPSSFVLLGMSLLSLTGVRRLRSV
ncbi:MAG: PEP-CTERM sorting domain-containing protein [Planctomycetes bacterium]|nr:PEP-CTERM sorting domain-containing protein [Planctomycetota bacterium]